MGVDNLQFLPVLRWTDHKDSQVLVQALAWIAASKPLCGCLENVQGIMTALKDTEEMSPGEFIVKELEKMNYSVTCADLCDCFTEWPEGGQSGLCLLSVQKRTPMFVCERCASELPRFSVASKAWKTYPATRVLTCLKLVQSQKFRGGGRGFGGEAGARDFGLKLVVLEEWAMRCGVCGFWVGLGWAARGDGKDFVCPVS